MNMVTFSEADEVVEYIPAEPAAAAHRPESSPQTLTRRRGRPPLIPEELSPLEHLTHELLQETVIQLRGNEARSVLFSPAGQDH